MTRCILREEIYITYNVTDINYKINLTFAVTKHGNTLQSLKSFCRLTTHQVKLVTFNNGRITAVADSSGSSDL